MESSYITILSLIVFLPAAFALLLAFVPRDRPDVVKMLSLACTAIVFLLTAWLAIPGSDGGVRFNLASAKLQDAFAVDWIPSFDIYYYMGFDGISFPLLVLTSFSCLCAMAASWNISKHVKAYCILFLLLETGMLGVFLALDFFLFYVFWEVMLLPMYFLIGVWGGPRREYAAIKFFLYTLLGSVFMLIAILMLYFTSDLVELAKAEGFGTKTENWQHLNVSEKVTIEVEKALASQERPQPIHTFNITALSKMGQHTYLFNAPLALGKSIQWWAFLLLFLGFLIKVPGVPVHTWLPDAHVEAPTPISMLLAGVMLKMGGYGILRICYPICPEGAYELRWFVCAIGVISMVYGAFAALAQKDFKRMVAYSSVSHMGYVVLGLGVWSVFSSNHYNPDYWAMGMNGAMFQMLAHGISSPGMFFMVGVIYDRVHHRNLDEFGGLFGRMPVYTALAFGIFFAGLGLPGLCGFIGEVLVTLSIWSFSKVLAIISAATVILTAAYILWMIQRVYLGPEYKGPHGDHITPMTGREFAIGAPLLALAILFGVHPDLLLRYTTPTVEATVGDLAAWAENKKPDLDLVKSNAASTAAVVPQRPRALLVQGNDR